MGLRGTKKPGKLSWQQMQQTVWAWPWPSKAMLSLQQSAVPTESTALSPVRAQALYRQEPWVVAADFLMAITELGREVWADRQTWSGKQSP